MRIDYVFQRIEMKYLLNAEQYAVFKQEMDARLTPDEHGETTIQSLYLDTDNNQLVRTSLEKPTYKEKMRFRCYGLNDCNKNIFLEMKRKSDGVVYKRRISCKENEVADILDGTLPSSQIGNELSYFLQFYPGLKPKMLILYDRTAYCDPQSDLRVTFDRRVRYRTESVDFHTSLEGKPILPEDTVIMELKSGTAFPLWLCRLLSENHVMKQSFSKYGTAYQLECLHQGA